MRNRKRERQKNRNRKIYRIKTEEQVKEQKQNM
jgi:hypothetical protein